MGENPVNHFRLTLAQRAHHGAARRASHGFAGSAGVFGCALAMLVMPVMAGAQTSSQDAANEPVAASASSPALSPLKPNPEYAQYPRYTGTLGTRHITLRLGMQGDDSTALQGEYQFDDTGEVRQIVGGRDGDTFEAEDSADGVNIAGNWGGTFGANGSLSGERMNPDDSGSQPFDLKRVSSGTSRAASAQTPASTSTPAHADVPASPTAKAPDTAPAASDGHAHQVEGISNLNTED